jgi:hypothetical protein
MNLYFQILTQVQTIEAIELLHFPLALVLDGKTEGTVKMSSGGKTSRFKFNDHDQLIAKIGKKIFNQFEVNYDSNKFNMGLRDTSVKSVTGVFTPSASGKLWFPSIDWPVGGEREMRTRKMNAKASERGLQTYGVLDPNIFEFVIEIETTLTKDAVLNDTSERVAVKVSEAFLQIKPFGCCDIGGKEFFVKMEAGVLMTEGIRIMAALWPATYPMLGLRFDKLHSVMFGNAELCKNIALSLGKDAKLFRKEDWAVVLINSKCNLSEANNRADEWLLLKENARIQTMFENKTLMAHLSETAKARSGQGSN